MADLPGFYYDKEKNRYFPIKGPIPGSSRSSSVAIAQETTPKSTRVCILFFLRVPNKVLILWGWCV